MSQSQSFPKLSIALGALLCLTACGELDTAKIETQLRQDLTKAEIPVKEITCPNQISSRTGQSFECVGQLKPSGNFFVIVTQEDERQTIRWEIVNSWNLLDLASLQSDLQAALQAAGSDNTKVDCGQAYRVISPGDRFECQATRSGQSSPIEINIREEGQITWQDRQPAPTVATALPAPQVLPTGTTAAAAPAARSTAAPVTPPAAAPAATTPAATTPAAPQPDQDGWAQLDD